MTPLGLILFILLALPMMADAQTQTPITVKQSTCTVTWDAPQANTDGTNLTDLKEYWVYVGTTLSGMTNVTAVVSAPAQDPAPGATASWPCKSLPIGVNHYVQIESVDTTGNRSARTAPLGPFVLLDDVSPLTPTSIRLGP
jgi:hypothetical protein